MKPKPTISSILTGFLLITIVCMFSAHKDLRIENRVIKSNEILISDNCFKGSYPSYTIKSQVLGSLMISAYSSTEDQTDSTPFITANGTRVEKGIVATNNLPFGTEIKIEGLGDFEVQDRMNKRYQDNEIDIWMETREEALEFGKQEIMVWVYE